MWKEKIRSGEDLADNTWLTDPGQSFLKSIAVIDKLLVIQPQQVQYGGVEQGLHARILHATMKAC